MPQPPHCMFPNSNMLNQSAVDALYSATYLEDYLDSVDCLPDDIQRHLTRLKEIDQVIQSYFRDISENMQRLLKLLKRSNSNQQQIARFQNRIQALLINCQELGDEKIHVVQEIHEAIENKTRQLELDRKNLESVHRSPSSTKENSTGSQTPQKDERKRVRRIRYETHIPSSLGPATLTPTLYNADGKCAQPIIIEQVSQIIPKTITSALHKSNQSADDQKTTGLNLPVSSKNSNSDEPSSSICISKDRTEKDSSFAPSSSSTSTTPKKAEKRNAIESKPPQQVKRSRRRRTSSSKVENQVTVPTDPDEPTYCLCDQVSYGEMILCDNDLCLYEWFHFSCVNLTTKPKGKWFCPKCRGDRSNQMKPKNIFLRELETYNKEKEERS